MPFVQSLRPTPTTGIEDTQPPSNCRFWVFIDTGLSPGTPVIGTLTAEATLNQDTMNYHKSCYQRVCITHFALFWSKAPVPVSWLRELGILSVTGTLNKLRSSSENSEAQVLEESADRHHGSGPCGQRLTHVSGWHSQFLVSHCQLCHPHTMPGIHISFTEI